MLQTLRIKNLAVIDSAEIPFRAGLNILSGETGAGKSIVIEAISLLLGSRASAELIRSGSDEAVIEGLFDLSGLPWMAERLERNGFPAAFSDSSAEAELLIKRLVHRGGRHRIYVNGQLATLAILQELCEGLIDLCGQNEHQSLVKPSTQLELLDRYGGISEDARDFGDAHSEYRELTETRARLELQESERQRRSDFLRFQIDELARAGLTPGEDLELQREKQLLQSAEARAQGAESARRILESDEGGVLSLLRAADSRLRSLSHLDPRAGAIQETLTRAIAETEDALLSLERYLGGVELDPEKLAQVQDRLALLAELRRKYGPSVAEMLETLERLRSELEQLDVGAEKLGALSSRIEAASFVLLSRAAGLTERRAAASTKLSQAVTAELKDLRMADAEFSVELEPHAGGSLERLTATGAEQARFCVRTNRGEASRPLGKIASGGELSRLMLAIRRVIADRGGIGVYLFDEIDAGIGGQTAFEVGKKLQSVARYNQVICITHLPQVASFADHHLSVRKQAQGDRTVTTVLDLGERGCRERREELARMLGGPELTRSSLRNAAELLELASRH
jgi:DNA repair protein RecN (Recombination protein N)